jgi:WD40 repeat protein
MSARPFLFALLLAAVPAFSAPLEIAPVERSEPVDFAREIYPVLKRNCLACHNATRAKANLNLESPALILKGGDSGPALTPGDSAKSLVLKSAAHLDEDLLMPPLGNKVNAVALTPAELGLLKLWIEQGAKGEAPREDSTSLAWRTQSRAPVNALAFSPDSRLVAVARGNRVDLCEMATGQVLAKLGDPELSKLPLWKEQAVADRDAVMSVAFGRDDLLATGGFREVRIWRRVPRLVKHDFGVLAEAPTTLAVSRDGKWAAAGDGKGAVWLWPLEAEKFEPTPLRDGTAAISALAFSPDGAVLLACAEDKSARVWSLAEKRMVYSTTAPEVVRSLAFLGEEIAAGCNDGVARVWAWPKEAPAEPQKPAREFKLQEQPLFALAALETSRNAKPALAWAGADGSLRTSSAADGKEIARSAREHPATRRVNAVENELRIARSIAAARKAELTATTDRAKKEGETAKKYAETFAKVQADYENLRVAAETAEETAQLAPEDKSTQEAAKKANTALAKAEGELRAAKANLELGQRLSSAAAGEQAAREAALALADAAATAVTATLDAVRKLDPFPAPRQLAPSPTDESFVVVESGGRFAHLSTTTGALMEPPDRAELAAVTKDGSLLTVGADKHVRLTTTRRVWKLERVIGRVDDPSVFADRVLALAFSPDGRLLAAAGGVPSRAGDLKLWRVSDGAPALSIEKAHADTINALAFSPDGETIATAGSDRFARIWRVADGTRLASLEGHGGHVLGAAWRADGLAFATSGADRTVRQWDLATRKTTKKIEGLPREGGAIAYAGDALLIATGEQARLGDQSLAGSKGAVFAIAADALGQFVAAGGEDGFARVWNAGDRKLAREFGP